MKCMLQKINKSFTMIELLITIVISSLVIIACFSVFQISYTNNLNMRKYYIKFQEIDYALNYMEREIKNAVFIDVKENNIHLKKYSYNDFLSNTNFQIISKFNDINFKKNGYNKKYDIDREAKDYLNSKSSESGKNKLIKDIDEVNFVKYNDKIVIKIYYSNKEFKKIINLDKINKFDYLNKE